jgi:hypothetical protein
MPFGRLFMGMAEPRYLGFGEGPADVIRRDGGMPLAATPVSRHSAGWPVPLKAAVIGWPCHRPSSATTGAAPWAGRSEWHPHREQRIHLLRQPAAQALRLEVMRPVTRAPGTSLSRVTRPWASGMARSGMAFMPDRSRANPAALRNRASRQGDPFQHGDMPRPVVRVAVGGGTEAVRICKEAGALVTGRITSRRNACAAG